MIRFPQEEEALKRRVGEITEMIIPSKGMKHPPTPTQIVAHLDRWIRGQAAAKRTLAVAVYNHYLLQAHGDKNGTDPGHHTFYLLVLQEWEKPPW